MSDAHEQDLAFMRDVREGSNEQLAMLRRWQACEAWRRIAIDREIARRARDSNVIADDLT